MLDYNEYVFSKKEKYLFLVTYVIGSLALAYLFYKNLFFGIVMIPFEKKVETFIKEYLIKKRKRLLLEEFKDCLFMISTSVGAGRGMKDAIGETIPSIEDIHGADSLLAVELRTIYKRLTIGNENDIDVLMDFANRSGNEDIYDFVTVYSTCKITGASLVIALNKAASVIIDKMTIEKEILELVKRKETEGLLIFLMPIIVILFLNICAADYISPLYDSLRGRLIMTGVIGAIILVYEMIRKIVNIEI